MRFHHVTQAFASLDALTNAVAQSFSTPLQAPSRSLIDVAIDFDCATEMLIRAKERDDTVGIAFYEAIRWQYIEKQAVIVSDNVYKTNRNIFNSSQLLFSLNLDYVIEIIDCSQVHSWWRI